MTKGTPPVALLFYAIWVITALTNDDGGCSNFFALAWISTCSRPICCLSGHRFVNTLFLSSNPDNNGDDEDNWGLVDHNDRGEDPRLKAMRTILESSWNGETMGVVPSNPQKAADAAASAVASAMAENHNVVMIDLRLPSYDVTEGTRFYDIMATSDFCSFLSDRLCERNLVRKSLLLVRNEQERAEIERVRSQRDQGKMYEVMDDTYNSSEDNDFGSELGDEKIDEFRSKLMDSWDAPIDAVEKTKAVESLAKPHSSYSTTKRRVTGKTRSSHRLWSMIGSSNISSGPDQFDQVIAAVDKNAILSTTAEPEDALIILSPYTTTDVIALRRILARYGQTRTIIIVNSRIEILPRELDSAVLVYGIMPLIARSRTKQNSGDGSGLKAVVMRRFPSKWAVFVDVYGDGFVETNNGDDTIDGSSKNFPSPEYIATTVQKHVEGLK